MADYFQDRRQMAALKLIGKNKTWSMMVEKQKWPPVTCSKMTAKVTWSEDGVRR